MQTQHHTAPDPLTAARRRYATAGARRLDETLAHRAEASASPVMNLALVGLAFAAAVAVALGLAHALPWSSVAWGLALPLAVLATAWTAAALARTARRGRALSRGTLVGAHPVETPNAGRRLVFSTDPAHRFDRQWLKGLARTLRTRANGHPHVATAMRELEAATGGLRRLPRAITGGPPAFLGATRDVPANGVQPAIVDPRADLVIPV